MTVLVLIETVLLALLSVLVAGLLRAYATVLQRLHRLDGGGAAPPEFQVAPAQPGPDQIAAPQPREDWVEAHDVNGETLTGEVVALRAVGVEHDTVLVFLSSGCSSCEVFWDEFARPSALRLPTRTRLLVVTQGAEADSRAALAELAAPGIDVVMSTSAWHEYGVPGSPYVVLVDGATGRVRGEGTGQSWDQVAQLLARSSGDAGFITSGSPGGKPASDAQREADADRELLAAGILPGDPRLYGDADTGTVA